LKRLTIRKNKPHARRLAKQPLCKAIVQWKGEQDRSLANGTVELINPSTNMLLRFNMKRFINVMFGHTMLPQLAKRGRVLIAGDLEDGKRTDQDLFLNFLVQYNDSGKPSYSHHAFEQVDDFVDTADFSSVPTTEWANAKRKFGELMADYEKLRNMHLGLVLPSLGCFQPVYLPTKTPAWGQIPTPGGERWELHNRGQHAESGSSIS
jgi:hypothetical protein